MNRAGQILLEVLVAGILLAVVIPYIPALCWKYAGPNWALYSAMVAENNARILLNEQQANLAVLQKQVATLAVTQKRAAQVAREQRDHERAMDLLSNFSTRQTNVWADCLIAAKRDLSQREKDNLIFTIWLRQDSSCGDLRMPKPK